MSCKKKQYKNSNPKYLRESRIGSHSHVHCHRPSLRGQSVDGGSGARCAATHARYPCEHDLQRSQENKRNACTYLQSMVISEEQYGFVALSHKLLKNMSLANCCSGPKTTGKQDLLSVIWTTPPKVCGWELPEMEKSPPTSSQVKGAPIIFSSKRGEEGSFHGRGDDKMGQC